MDKKILKHLYLKRNEDEYPDVSKLFPKIEKNTIDNCVVRMEEIGNVEKRVIGSVGNRAVPRDQDQSDANNSCCKITAQGIEHYENHIKNKTTKKIAIGALIVSILAILLQGLQYYNSIKH